MGKKSVLYISCGIFKEELEYLVREKGLDWDVLFVDAALHVNFDKLKSGLTEALKSREPETEIKVIYGFCHPEIGKILAGYNAKRIAARNCLEAMVGHEEIKKIDSEGKAFFLSAGWVNNWKKMFSLGEKDFNFDFSTMFTNYKRIVVFETGVIPIDESELAEFSRFTSLPVERRRISLDHLLELIRCI